MTCYKRWVQKAFGVEPRPGWVGPFHRLGDMKHLPSALAESFRESGAEVGNLLGIQSVEQGPEAGGK